MLRVFVVDDHPVIRLGLSTIVRGEADLDLVGTADDGAHAVAQILGLQPDVVLLDLLLPRKSGVAVMSHVLPRAPEVRFLILSGSDSETDIAAALAAGARGYLLKAATPEEIVHAIRLVGLGGAAIEPLVVTRMLSQVYPIPTRDGLSVREYEVLALLVRGASNREIARQMIVTEHTVKSHLGSLFDKLRVHSRGAAVAVALQRGLVTPPTRSRNDGTRNLHGDRQWSMADAEVMREHGHDDRLEQGGE